MSLAQDHVFAITCALRGMGSFISCVTSKAPARAFLRRQVFQELGSFDCGGG